MKAVANGKVTVSYQGAVPLRNRRKLDADMKVRLTRVGQMTSLGMSRRPRRPRISCDRVCDYETTGNYVILMCKIAHALSEFRLTSPAPVTGKGGVLRVNPSLLHSLNPLPLRRPSYRVGWH
jgi:hypothetical protein